jgi:hypothetical protein
MAGSGHINFLCLCGHIYTFNGQNTHHYIISLPVYIHKTKKNNQAQKKTKGQKRVRRGGATSLWYTKERPRKVAGSSPLKAE